MSFDYPKFREELDAALQHVASVHEIKYARFFKVCKDISFAFSYATAQKKLNVSVRSKHNLSVDELNFLHNVTRRHVSIERKNDTGEKYMIHFAYKPPFLYQTPFEKYSTSVPDNSVTQELAASLTFAANLNETEGLKRFTEPILNGLKTGQRRIYLDQSIPEWVPKMFSNEKCICKIAALDDGMKHAVDFKLF